MQRDPITKPSRPTSNLPERLSLPGMIRLTGGYPRWTELSFYRVLPHFTVSLPPSFHLTLYSLAFPLPPPFNSSPSTLPRSTDLD